MTNLRCAALAALVASGGCSAIFMERVPANYDPFTSDVHCSGGKGFVAWDATLAIAHFASIIGGAYLALKTEMETEGIVMVSTNGAFAIAHTASAASGANWANECRRQRAFRTQVENAKR